MLAGLLGSSFTLEVCLPLESVMGKRTHHLSIREKSQNHVSSRAFTHNAELIYCSIWLDKTLFESVYHIHTTSRPEHNNKFITGNHKLLFMRTPLHRVLFGSVFTKHAHHYRD